MVQIVTLGCRINSYESEVLKEKLSGLDNLIIVNTCAVTGEAERQCRQTIRKLRRENPDARIVVTGCAAQVAPQKFAEMPGSRPGSRQPRKSRNRKVHLRPAGRKNHCRRHFQLRFL